MGKGAWMVTVTPVAAAKLKDILKNDSANYLRVYAQGGGCSGLQYGMAPEKEKSEADTEFETEGVKIIIDPISIRYLDGIEISWDDTVVMGGGFQMKNPNAKGTCGCGQSFEPKD